MSKMVSEELFDKYADVLYEVQQLAVAYSAFTKTMCNYVNNNVKNPLPYFTDHTKELEERRKELFQKYLDI